MTDALVISAPGNTVLDASTGSWLKQYGIKHLMPSLGMNVSCLEHSGITVMCHPPSWTLPPGPYIFSVGPTGNSIYQAYGLHRDNFEAFLFGVTPIPGSSAYAPVEPFIPAYQDAWIPVPSRLYSIGDTRPLAGIRVGLKDIYDLEGVQTGGGSRSYAEVYPAANATAVTMQKMFRLGAVIVVSLHSRRMDPYRHTFSHITSRARRRRVNSHMALIHGNSSTSTIPGILVVMAISLQHRHLPVVQLR